MSSALVIIPTYNEKDNIKLIIDAVFSLPSPFHILIVDDSSPDGTATEVIQLQDKYNTSSSTCLHLVSRPKKAGLGPAYINGYQYALRHHSYAYILQMDADFSHNPKDLPKLLDECKTKNFDLAIGSRYYGGINIVNWPMGRILLSYFASYYVRLITGIPIHDTTAGFVCYKRQVLDKLPLDEIMLSGYAFQVEMKFLAWKYGFSITEVPIIFTDRVRGESKMSVQIFWEAFFGVIRMKIKSLFKKF